MVCTLLRPTQIRTRKGAIRTFSKHLGGPCADPDCLFRRPIPRAESSRPTPIADELRRAARALTEELARRAEELEQNAFPVAPRPSNGPTRETPEQTTDAPSQLDLFSGMKP